MEAARSRQRRQARGAVRHASGMPNRPPRSSYACPAPPHAMRAGKMRASAAHAPEGHAQ